MSDHGPSLPGEALTPAPFALGNGGLYAVLIFIRSLFDGVPPAFAALFCAGRIALALYMAFCLDSLQNGMCLAAVSF